MTWNVTSLAPSRKTSGATRAENRRGSTKGSSSTEFCVIATTTPLTATATGISSVGVVSNRPSI